MKKITLILTLLFLGTTLSFAQSDPEKDMIALSLMDQYVKGNPPNYEAAYPHFMELRKRNPKYSRVIYASGEKILQHKIDNSTGAEKVAFINDLLKLWEERAIHYESHTPKGEYAAQACQLMYDNRGLLNKTDAELYACFDTAYNLDKTTFTNPKSLYTYFSLMVDLYDAGQKSASDLFNKYDDVVEKIEEEVENYSLKLNKLVEKEDAGTALTRKENSYKNYYESYLRNYDLISGSVDSKLGERANCENLIPLYEKGFEENKTNEIWLQRAAGKMSEKECTDDPLFFKLVNAYHDLSPSANSAYYLGILKDKEGKTSEAISFYEQAIGLEKDAFKKSKLYNRIALKLKSRGNYSKARSYFREALKYNPSNGRPHLSIAAMYAASANDCGDTNFNKRAVYWLAADEAKKASRVDPTLSKAAKQSVDSYMDKAPSKSDVFSCACSGQVIQIKCWIGASVTVPNI